MVTGSGASAIVQRFSYDSSGSVVSVDYSSDNGTTFTTYYYLRNGQGDVVKLIDGTGTAVVEYTYDSWGQQLSCTGSLSTSLGANQPFRYRGYVYDVETGWYYLQSRYYDPATCHFISADVLLSTGQGVIGNNSFAYCGNNPVNAFDDDGEWSLPNWAKIVIGVAAIGIGVAVTVATGGAAAPAIIAGVKTALVVGSISAGTSVAKTAVTSVVNGDDFSTFTKKAVESATDGFCDGFMSGGIMAGASMTFGLLLKGANGLQIGQQISKNQALQRIRSGGDVYANSRSAAKALVKDAFGNSKAYWEVHIELPNAMKHFHDASNHFFHVFFN